MQKSETSTVKRGNKLLILHTFIGKSELSKADVAARTGLSPATLSHLMTELTQEGFLYKSHVAESSGGRRPILFRLNDSMASVLSMNLTPDGVTLSVINLSCGTLYHETLLMPICEEASCLAAIRQAVTNVRAQGCDLSALSAVAIGVPGVIDHKTCDILFSDTLHIRRLNLRDCFSDLSLGSRTYLFKDTDALLLGEYYFTFDANVTSIAYLLCNRGVGMSMLTDGRLMTQSGYGLELGDSILGYNTMTDAPRSGTVGAILSERPAAEQYTRLYERQDGRLRPVCLNLTLGDLVEMYLSGDPLAKPVIQEQLHALQAVVSNITNLLSPQILVLDSPLSLTAPDFEKRLTARTGSRMLSPFGERLRILRPQLKDSAPLLGMANHVLRTIVFSDMADRLFPLPKTTRTQPPCAKGG